MGDEPVVRGTVDLRHGIWVIADKHPDGGIVPIHLSRDGRAVATVFTDRALAAAFCKLWWKARHSIAFINPAETVKYLEELAKHSIRDCSINPSAETGVVPLASVLDLIVKFGDSR